MVEPSNESIHKVLFKNPDYQKNKATLDKKRSLAKIIQLERSMPWDKESVHFSSIDAPPSLKPIKKYSDISGFSAKYRDPTTGLLFADIEEYSVIQSLPSDIIAGYLSLRATLPK